LPDATLPPLQALAPDVVTLVAVWSVELGCCW